MCVRPYEHGIPDDGRHGDEHRVGLCLGEKFEFGGSLDDGKNAVATEQVNFTAGLHGRDPMILKATQSFTVKLLAGFCVVATDHSAAVANQEQLVPNDKGRGDVRNAPACLPPDVRIGDIARAGWINGEEIFRDAGVGENQSVPEDGFARDIIAEAGAVADKPQFFASRRIVGISRLRSRADQLFFAVVFDYGRGGIRFSIVVWLVLWRHPT